MIETKDRLIAPHASNQLISLAVMEEDQEAALERSKTLPRITLSAREKGDLLMMGAGGFTPLVGFMGHDDWRSVCQDMQTQAGFFWPIPITLSTSREFAERLRPNDAIALTDTENNILGVLNYAEHYSIDKDFEAKEVFSTTSEEHPGVAMIQAQGEVNIAGKVKVFTSDEFVKSYSKRYLTPAECRAKFIELGWETIAAFQTRNPMHRSHEYLAKIAIEITDGVLIHSLLGDLKPGDIPPEISFRAIEKLVDLYFVKNTVVQSGYPLSMRYGGPREALLHALFRQNYGCTHQIVGRDHAGVGSFYEPLAAQKIFTQLPKDALLIRPLCIDWTFWCYACGGMASNKTCPHEQNVRLAVSGTALRAKLANDEPIAKEFSRPEVLAVLREYYQQINSR